MESNNYADPIVPALAIPQTQPIPPPFGTKGSGKRQIRRELNIADEHWELPRLDTDDLPHCPKCSNGLLRPGVVWFGEELPKKVVDDIDTFIKESRKIDLMLVIGTSAQVYPAAGYIDKARAKGAKVAVINMDKADTGSGGLEPGDWFFEGDASVLIPELLKAEIGVLSNTERKESTGENDG